MCQLSEPTPFVPAKLHQNTTPIHPKISVIENTKRQFLCSDSIPSKYRTIRTNDNRISKYFLAVQKILGAFCKELKLRDLWVCQKDITTYPVLVYFTEPLWYPVMECCRKCLFVEFECELSGSVKCIQCKRVGFSFVHVEQDPRAKSREKHSQNRRYSKTQISQHKENNFMVEQRTEIEKQNQKIYKQYKHRNDCQKSQIRKLISSNQHRHQSIKKVMGLKPTPSKQKNEELQEKVASTLEIGQFIIEIEENNQLKDEWERGCTALTRNRRMPPTTDDGERSTKSCQHSALLNETCRELRSIIECIFL